MSVTKIKKIIKSPLKIPSPLKEFPNAKPARKYSSYIYYTSICVVPELAIEHIALLLRLQKDVSSLENT